MAMRLIPFSIVATITGVIWLTVLAEPVVPEVQKQQSVMRSERFNLKLPSLDRPTCPVNEDHPWRIGVVTDDLVMKQRG